MILNESQILIQQAAKNIAEQHIKPNAAKWAKNHEFPINTIKQLGGLGFMGMLVPEEYGGTNIGHIAYSLVIEEIAAADGSCSTIVSVHNSVASLPILKFGTKAQKEQFLTPLASGKKLGAFCLTEAEAGSDAAAIQTKAKLVDDHYIINGAKQFITAGKSADIAIVFAVLADDKKFDDENKFDNNNNTNNSMYAKTNMHTNTNTHINHKKNMCAFIVPTNTKGYKVLKIEDKMGLDALETAQLAFDNMKVPKENLLGNVGDGYKIALSSLESGRIGIAAQSVGMARHAFTESLKYAKERKTFGKLLIDHQVINFMLAEMDTNINAARAFILHAAAMHDNNQSAKKEAAEAKLFATTIAEKVCHDAIQIFGGYGYLKDFPVERIYRDIRATTIYEGSSEMQKMIIAKCLQIT